MLESSTIVDGAVWFLNNTAAISSSLTSNTFKALTAEVNTDAVKDAISSNVQTQLENGVVTNTVKSAISGAVSASLWNTVDEYTSAITGAVSGEINSDINTPAVKSAISSAVSSSLWNDVGTEYTSAIIGAVSGDLYNDLALSNGITGGITGDVVDDLYNWFATDNAASNYRNYISLNTYNDLYDWFATDNAASDYRNSITSDTATDLFYWFIDMEGENYRNSISSYVATQLYNWFTTSTSYKNSISSSVYNDLITDDSYTNNISDAVSASVKTHMINYEINNIVSNVENYFTTGEGNLSNDIIDGTSGYFITGGGGDLTDIIADGASGYFTTGPGDLTDTIVNDVSNYFENNSSLQNTIADGASGYFTTGAGDLTDIIADGASGYFINDSALETTIMHGALFHFITGGDGDLTDIIADGASGYFTTGAGAETLIDDATTNIESYFTTSPGNDLIIDPVTSNWNQDFTDLYDNWSNSLYSSSAQFAEELQFFSKANLIQFVNSEDFYFNNFPLSLTATQNAITGAATYQQFLDKMIELDPLYENSNTIRIRNEQAIIQAQIDAENGEGVLDFYDLWDYDSFDYVIEDNQKINIYGDDRFITLTGSYGVFANLLNVGLASVTSYWDECIEGEDCVIQAPDVIFDDNNSNISISSSIWIKLLDLTTENEGDLLSKIKLRITDLNELKKCYLTLHNAQYESNINHPWKRIKFPILDWKLIDFQLQIKIGNIRKNHIFYQDGIKYNNYCYFWTAPNGVDMVPSGVNRDTELSFSIIIDETLPVLKYSDLTLPNWYNAVEEDPYRDLRNNSILNLRTAIWSWALTPPPDGPGWHWYNPEWNITQPLQLPLLNMTFPANSEYIFEAKALLPHIEKISSAITGLKYGFGLVMEAWAYEGEEIHEVIYSDSPLTSNIGQLIFTNCYMSGRKFSNSTGVIAEKDSFIGGTTWNTIQAKVPNLSIPSNWFNPNTSIGENSQISVKNIMIKFSFKTNFDITKQGKIDWDDLIGINHFNGGVYLKDFALYASNPQGESFVDANNIKFYNDGLESPAYEKVFENGNLKTGLIKSDGTVSLDSDNVVDYLLGRRKIPGLKTASLISDSLLVNRNLRVLNSFEAKSKSFLINDQQHNNMLLQHGSLEGPEHGVYIRNVIKSNSNSHLIEFPDYWSWLINPDSITVIITPMGRWQELWYEVTEKGIIIRNNKDEFIECSIQINAERIDVNKLQLRIEK